MVDIEKLRGLLARATKGPWTFSKRGLRIYGGITNGKTIAAVNVTPEFEADGQLIVAAVNTLPALLDELERKTKALEAVEIARHTDDPEDWTRATKLTAAALKGTPNAD